MEATETIIKEQLDKLKKLKEKKEKALREHKLIKK